MGSFYDVIRRCNKFEEKESAAMWEFVVLDNSVPVGYMLPEHVAKMRWDNTSFNVSKSKRRIHLDPVIKPGDNAVDVCRREFISLCEENADNLNGCFKKWLKKRSDFHPIRGLDAKLAGLVIASPARGIFGIVTTGVHMNMFTMKSGEIHVWVSRRSQNVTYAGKLDQLVAGAMDPVDHMDPLMTLKREAMEEAGLVVDIHTKAVTWKGVYAGTVTAESLISFYDQKDHIAGSEEGHIEPGIRYTFDLEVGPDFVPYPEEPESIDGFALKPVEEVKRDLKNAEWKPNCGLVMLDFLLRKGEIKEGEDENFGLLRRGLHRKLPFRNL
jgi:8-oxo-dGTP pyrophosphatase MutT (NUDIX family)